MVTDPANIDSYQQGGSLKIICMVKSGESRRDWSKVYDLYIAGTPLPNVTWTINDSTAAVDSLMARECPRSGGRMLSVTMSVSPPSLLVSSLSSSCVPRMLAGAKLGCSASNNNISLPARSHIYLNVIGKKGDNCTQRSNLNFIHNSLQNSWQDLKITSCGSLVGIDLE